MTNSPEDDRDSLIDAAYLDLQSAARALAAHRGTSYNSRDPLPYELATEAEIKARAAMEDIRRLMPGGRPPA